MFKTNPFFPAVVMAGALWLAGMLSPSRTFAADVREVNPVTADILAVHFDEGHIDQGTDEKTARPYITKLNTEAAAQPQNYSITSEDDPRYKTAQHPTKVGRKAKAADTLSLYRPEKFVLDHWVYLVLPQPLQRGCTYTVKVDQLSSHVPSCTFLFHENAVRSETVHVNQIGFPPEAPKYAYLSHWMGDMGGANLDAYAGKPFHLIRDADGARVFEGKVAKRKDTKTGAPATNSPIDGTPWNGAKKAAEKKNFTEADVFECDFSGFKTPGTYRVVVENMGCSFPFEIHEDAYRRAYYTVSRGLFFQRAGLEKAVEPGLTYPRGHHPDDKLNAFQYDKNWRFIDHPHHNHKITPTGELKLWGWYHDAGDWDGYPGHVNVPLSLLLLYDLAGEKFADGQVGNQYKSNEDGKMVDEGKNGVPDLLDEASWLIQYYRRARAMGQEAGLTTGGVPGSYAGVDSCAGGASWKDTRALMFSAEDPAATYQYAACAAWLATCLNKAAGGTHPESAAWLKEAREAYEWAKANTRDGDGPKISDHRMLASLCLFRETKDAAYHTQFKADLKADVKFQRSEYNWSTANFWEFAAGIYGLLPADFPGLDAAFQKEVREKVLLAADRDFVNTAAQRGYRYGFAWNRSHSIGTFSSPILYQPAIAYKITGERKYLDVMYTSTSYTLGGNPMNMVWVTGLGQRPVKFPFHPDSWALIDYNSMVYDNEILPGIVPYGSCNSVDFFGPGYKFSGDEDFSRSSAYPDVETWPLSETRFENRYSIAAGEFTIIQDIAPCIFAYGFLCGPGAKTSAANPRPGVALTFPKEGSVHKAGGDVALRVKTTPDVRRVEYYFNEHFLGETRVPPFNYTWQNAPQGAWLITAKAFDDQGLVSRPNDPHFDVDANIKVEAGAAALPPEMVKIVNAPQKALNVHAVLELAVDITPLESTAQGVTWISSNPAVATVNSLGQVCARVPGRAVIKATTRTGNMTAECPVEVVAGTQ